MDRVTVVIPTRGRIDKLQRCLNTIPYEDWLDAIVVCDGDAEGYSRLMRRYEGGKGIEIRLIEGHHGAVFCRNSVMPEIKDGVLYATDDITFFERSIEYAFQTFNERFPDDDGVVGFVQEGTNGNFHPTGVALVGKKFLDRYPNRQLFNPAYFHFSCQEIHWLAMKLGKFVQDKRAKVFHYHPGFDKSEMDVTHREARIFRQQDLSLIRERERRGLIWGV